MRAKKIKTYVLMVSRVFPSTHKREGEETGFPEKIVSTLLHNNPKKIHTIRANYQFWEKRIKDILEGNAILSIRCWSGKPYNSKQIEIWELDQYSGIGLQRVLFNNTQRFDEIANNDGLSLSDFKEWFKNYDLSKPLAIIHFTKFRY